MLKKTRVVIVHPFSKGLKLFFRHLSARLDAFSTVSKKQ
jgi:hypothetical protein